jgi:hypothetical protein
MFANLQSFTENLYGKHAPKKYSKKPQARGNGGMLKAYYSKRNEESLQTIAETKFSAILKIANINIYIIF